MNDVLLGMKEGEVKNVRIPPNKAYGIKVEDSIRFLPKSLVDNHENLKINDVVTIVSPDGARIGTYVKEIGEENITIDLNHPLAGEFIQFSIVLRSIE